MPRKLLTPVHRYSRRVWVHTSWKDELGHQLRNKTLQTTSTWREVTRMIHLLEKTVYKESLSPWSLGERVSWEIKMGYLNRAWIWNLKLHYVCEVWESTFWGKRAWGRVRGSYAPGLPARKKSKSTWRDTATTWADLDFHRKRRQRENDKVHVGEALRTTHIKISMPQTAETRGRKKL